MKTGNIWAAAVVMNKNYELESGCICAFNVEAVSRDEALEKAIKISEKILATSCVVSNILCVQVSESPNPISPDESIGFLTS